MDKNMAVKASIDIGENITTLIQQLANQIGTTADKVFPWYVQQQVIEGWMFITILASLVFIFGFTFLISLVKSDNFNEDGPITAIGIVSAIIGGASVIILCIGATDAVSQIVNPNYHAMKALVRDMSMLVK